MPSMPSTPPPTLPRRLARFALEQSSLNPLPPPVATVSKEMMVNAAAVGLAGAAQAEGYALTRFVQEMGGNGKCTLIGKGLRTSPLLAALANGIMIHLLDFDDAIVAGGSHPTSVIFPVVMALGEMHGSPGREALAAFILGCELVAKLDAVWGPDAACAAAAASIGAAAAAGRLLELDAEQLEQAIALAGIGAVTPAYPDPERDSARGAGLGSGSASLPQGDTGPAPAGLAGPDRAYRQGRAAMHGVMAALLARQGLAGPGIRSRAFPHWDDGGDDGKAGDFFARLGNPYAVISPGVSLKLYPCAVEAHTAIDAALQLGQQYRLDPAMIGAVQVRTTPAALESLPFPTPGNGWEARGCLSYIVAVALLYGQPLIDNFTDAATQEGRVRRMMDLVTVAATEKPSRSIPYPCSLTITLNDGRQLHHRVEFARGQPELPLTPEELDAKFLYCSRYILPPDHIEEAVTRLRDLENIENTTGLFSVLGG